MKKMVASILASAVLITTMSSTLPVSTTTEAVTAASGNYAGALQQSLYFYECQQANELPKWNRVEWKGNCTMDDYIKGGWYDAGDHVKFNLPMAYSAATLAWGLYMYGDGVEKIGQYQIYQNNLEYTLDYLADCDLGDEVVFQVGNGTEDHTWWGPVELLEYAMTEGSYYKRPYYTGTSSAVCGEMAAALAAGAVALKGKSDKTDNYLKHAENIFKIADTTRSDDEYNDSNASGFYRSSHFYDELFWAANWLYMATGDQAYLDKATSYIPNLGKELGTSDLKYSWAQCWDDVQQGGMLLYAINTKNETYIKQVEKHVSYWTNTVKELPGGLRWVDSWGCLRYATSAGFVASIACDTVLKDSPNVDSYKEFAKEQIDYCLGNNPDNRCYVVGLDESSPKNPHHRTAHGSWKNAEDTPVETRHILYGALVGGPTETGAYEDDRGNYVNNEVATDYNAGYTGLLCKMVSEYGGKTDPDFPKPEVRTDEYFIQASMKTLDASGATLSFKFTNHTAWPARYQDNMSFRYYMDLSEIKKAGKNPEDITIRCDRNQSTMYSECKPAEISELKHYDGDIYYIEVTMPDGKIALPISEGRHQCEFLIAFVFPDYGSGWDATNDFSNQDLMDTDTTTSTIAKYIPIYYNGELAYGCEPDGTTAQPQTTTKPVTTKPVVTTVKPEETKVTVTTTAPVTTTKNEQTKPPVTTTTPVTTVSKTTTSSSDNQPPKEIIYGDLNGDKDVDLSDLIIMSQYMLHDIELTPDQLIIGDVTGDGKTDILDLPRLKQFIMKDKITLGPKTK